MRVCIVALNRYAHDTYARVLARSLRDAGNDVVVVASGPDGETELDGIRVCFVPTRYPVGRGRNRRLLRRAQPLWLRRILHRRALAARARSTGADIFHPTSAAAVGVAVKAARRDGTVARQPTWPDAGSADLIHVAPHRPEASVSPAGAGLPLHMPEGASFPVVPHPDRHEGKRVALCYRKTDTNPGRYLEAALRRAGVEVDLFTEVVEWDRLSPGADAMVFVESPYPALRIVGRNPGLPVLFWVHHGEHRLMANLRLSERYGAHAVLLGHSWHLTHRFPVPVHRFPFAIAPEIFEQVTPPHAARTYDVAFVGAGLENEDNTYAQRRRLLAEIEATLGPGRVAFRQGISAAEMARTYEQARVVPDEGGTQHFPITMRAFEAIGAGALLHTKEAPGIDLLLVPDRHYVAMGGDPVMQLESLLDDPVFLEARASEARRHALAYHTYDHRVDDLFAVLDTIKDLSPRPQPEPKEGLAALVDADVDIQVVAAFGAPALAAELPTREVRDGEAMLDRLGPGTIEGVAIGEDGTAHLERALRAAQRAVYATGLVEEVVALATRMYPKATFVRSAGGVAVDVARDRFGG